MDLKPGDTFRKWTIRDVIGQGGFGKVYRVYDPFLDIQLALKLIDASRHQNADSAYLLQKARGEARLLSRIKSDNVVKFQDAGVTEDGHVYITMELLEGRDLGQVLREYGKLAPEEVLQIIVQVAAACAEAHELGAIHRDLKPQNIFITPNNVVKLLDFGIAKVHGLGATTATLGPFCGTLYYVAPEQLHGQQVNERTDVFSLGIVAYETAHKNPFAGAQTLEQFAFQLVGYNPPLLSKCDPEIPDFVAEYIDGFIQKDPARRHGSMHVVISKGVQVYQKLCQWKSQRGMALAARDLSGLAGDASDYQFAVPPPFGPAVPAPLAAPAAGAGRASPPDPPRERLRAQRPAAPNHARAHAQQGRPRPRHSVPAQQPSTFGAASLSPSAKRRKKATSGRTPLPHLRLVAGLSVVAGLGTAVAVAVTTNNSRNDAAFAADPVASDAPSPTPNAAPGADVPGTDSRQAAAPTPVAPTAIPPSPAEQATDPTGQPTAVTSKKALAPRPKPPRAVRQKGEATTPDSPKDSELSERMKKQLGILERDLKEEPEPEPKDDSDFTL